MREIQNALDVFEKESAKMFELIKDLTDDQINWKMSLVLDDVRWSVREIMAHMEEVNNFWLKQFKEALENPDRHLGRTEEEFEIRQIAVDQSSKRDFNEIVENVKLTVPLVRAVLGNITDDQWEAQYSIVGQPEEVKLHLGFFIDHCYPEHVDFHIKHIERTLFAYGQYH
ncbi:DinB family protein [Fusibacter bizertensis]